jgi:hypothetical protein
LPVPKLTRNTLGKPALTARETLAPLVSDPTARTTVDEFNQKGLLYRHGFDQAEKDIELAEQGVNVDVAAPIKVPDYVAKAASQEANRAGVTGRRVMSPRAKGNNGDDYLSATDDEYFQMVRYFHKDNQEIMSALRELENDPDNAALYDKLESLTQRTYTGQKVVPPIQVEHVRTYMDPELNQKGLSRNGQESLLNVLGRQEEEAATNTISQHQELLKKAREQVHAKKDQFDLIFQEMQGQGYTGTWDDFTKMQIDHAYGDLVRKSERLADAVTDTTEQYNKATRYGFNKITGQWENKPVDREATSTRPVGLGGAADNRTPEEVEAAYNKRKAEQAEIQARKNAEIEAENAKRLALKRTADDKAYFQRESAGVRRILGGKKATPEEWEAARQQWREEEVKFYQAKIDSYMPAYKQILEYNVTHEKPHRFTRDIEVAINTAKSFLRSQLERNTSQQ